MNAEFTQEDRDRHFGRQDPGFEVPTNLEAEQALLGAILVNNEALSAIRMPLVAEHFYEPIHRQMFESAQELIKSGRNANPVTLRQLVAEGMIGDMTVAQYMARLASDAVSILMVDEFAHAIIDAAARRACVSLGQRIEQTAYSKELSILDELDALRAKFDAVARALSSEQGAKTLADATRRSLASTVLAYQGKGMSGVDYGIPFLMQMIGPLLPGQLIIVGGMTKHGKSSLIEQIIAGAAINGHPVWVNSGEMKDEELARRALSRMTDIKAWQQVRGKVSDADYESLDRAYRNAATWQERVFIRDDTMTLRQIEREMADFSKRNPNGMAIVDHVGLVDKDSAHARTNDAEFSSIVTRKLKVFAGNNKIPVVAAAQLKKNIFEITDKAINRKTYMKVIGRRPKAADLFGSCEKDADHVIAPFRAEAVMDENEPAEMDDLHAVWDEVMGNVRNKAEIVLSLSRHTRWPQRKEVGWNGGKTMFTELQSSEQGRMAL